MVEMVKFVVLVMMKEEEGGRTQQNRERGLEVRLMQYAGSIEITSCYNLQVHF